MIEVTRARSLEIRDYHSEPIVDSRTVLNGLVCERYFPDEPHAAGLGLFGLVEMAQSPDVKTLAEAQRLPHLRDLFETLHDATHPIRIALDKLQTLDTVCIIEGRE